MRWLRCAGRTRSDSTRLSNSTLMTTTGMFRKNFPLTPGTKSIGAKATQVVSTLKITGWATSCTPVTAARKRPMPFERRS